MQNKRSKLYPCSTKKCSTKTIVSQYTRRKLTDLRPFLFLLQNFSACVDERIRLLFVQRLMQTKEANVSMLHQNIQFAYKTYLLHKTIVSDFAKVCFFVLFHKQNCTRFTRLVGRLSPCPKYLKNPYNAIFLKSLGSKDIKNDILDCQIHKYTNKNSQIHKYSL